MPDRQTVSATLCRLIYPPTVCEYIFYARTIVYKFVLNVNVFMTISPHESKCGNLLKIGCGQGRCKRTTPGRDLKLLWSVNPSFEPAQGVVTELCPNPLRSAHQPITVPHDSLATVDLEAETMYREENTSVRER